MLWILSAVLLVIWLAATFLFHKGGLIHTLLLVAVAVFVIQLVQDRRTKAYKRNC